MASFLTAIWEAIFGKPATVAPSADPPSPSPASPATVRPAARAPRLRSVGDLEVDDHPWRDGNVSFHLRRTYYVEGRLSPSGRFLVGAHDGHEEDGRTKSGSVILVDPRSGRELFRASVKRANNPHVSDDGLVIVENWKSWGGPLAGALVAFDATGKKLWERSFKANIYTSGMSEDGQTVFVSTCSSDHAPHDAKTWLLHAKSGEGLFERNGFGQVRFEGSRLVIGIEGDTPSPTNRFFALDKHGTAPPEYEAAHAAREVEANRGKPWWVFPKVQEALADADPPLDELATLLDDVERSGAPLTDHDRGRIERWRGEIAERRGQAAEALKHWDRALALNPQVGIKRRYEALKRRV